DARLPDPALAQAVAEAWQAWRAAVDERARLEADARDREQRLDLLRYQLRELEGFAPVAGEAAELAAEFSRLANAGKLAEGAGGALELVYESDAGAAHDAVARAAEQLAELAELDAGLVEPQRLLAEAQIQLAEAAGELRRYLGGLEMDPARLDAVQARLEGLKTLAHKHQVEADGLAARQAALATEIEDLEQAEVRLGRATAQVEATEEAYRKAAARLGEARAAAARELSTQVTALMH